LLISFRDSYVLINLARKGRMIVRTTSKEPEKLVNRFADGQVVDAGNSPGHETVFIGILSVSCTDPDKKRPSVTNGNGPFIVPPILPRRSDNTMSISYTPPGTEIFDRRARWPSVAVGQ
jgi:hypothetical protein